MRCALLLLLVSCCLSSVPTSQLSKQFTLPNIGIASPTQMSSPIAVGDLIYVLVPYTFDQTYLFFFDSNLNLMGSANMTVTNNDAYQRPRFFCGSSAANQIYFLSGASVAYASTQQLDTLNTIPIPTGCTSNLFTSLDGQYLYCLSGNSIAQVSTDFSANSINIHQLTHPSDLSLRAVTYCQTSQLEANTAYCSAVGRYPRLLTDLLFKLSLSDYTISNVINATSLNFLVPSSSYQGLCSLWTSDAAVNCLDSSLNVIWSTPSDSPIGGGIAALNDEVIVLSCAISGQPGLCAFDSLTGAALGPVQPNPSVQLMFYLTQPPPLIISDTSNYVGLGSSNTLVRFRI